MVMELGGHDTGVPLRAGGTGEHRSVGRSCLSQAVPTAELNPLPLGALAARCTAELPSRR